MCKQVSFLIKSKELPICCTMVQGPSLCRQDYVWQNDGAASCPHPSLANTSLGPKSSAEKLHSYIYVSSERQYCTKPRVHSIQINLHVHSIQMKNFFELELPTTNFPKITPTFYIKDSLFCTNQNYSEGIKIHQESKQPGFMIIGNAVVKNTTAQLEFLWFYIIDCYKTYHIEAAYTCVIW